MADVHSAYTRSYNMSCIHGKDTKPEELVRKYLFSKYRAVVFVNGCFWHGHAGCRYFVWPKNNSEFWKKKIDGNVARDERTYKLLCDLGWRVFVVWECELKPSVAEKTLNSLICYIKQVVTNT